MGPGARKQRDDNDFPQISFAIFLSDFPSQLPILFFFSLHWFVKFTLNEKIYSFVCFLVCFPLMLVSNSTFVDHSLKGRDDRIDNG